MNKSSAGIIVNKQVRNRIVQKRIHSRIEHLRPSRCREAFVKRVQENDKLKTEANKAGKPVSTKRQVAGPRGEVTVSAKLDDMSFRNHKPYIALY